MTPLKLDDKTFCFHLQLVNITLSISYAKLLASSEQDGVKVINKGKQGSSNLLSSRLHYMRYFPSRQPRIQGHNRIFFFLIIIKSRLIDVFYDLNSLVITKKKIKKGTKHNLIAYDLRRGEGRGWGINPYSRITTFHYIPL